MPGMNTGLGTHNSVIVSTFIAQLTNQFLIILCIAFALMIFGNLWRTYHPPSSSFPTVASDDNPVTADADVAIAATSEEFAEPVARRILRYAFGIIWIFDGLLQAQTSMPLGMAPQVIQPAAASSPTWVQHLDNAMATIWSFHPISAPAAAVWIQIGLGVWILVAPRGWWSRLGGASTIVWGLIVWVFGEAFGGIFAPGSSWLFGAPGGVLFYCAAGFLIALPERHWRSASLGKVVLRTMGVFFVGMAVLQAWPGRGFWQGQVRGSSTPGTLTAMVQQMSQTSQPRFISTWVSGFGTFDAAHGFAVNLFVVVALTVLGAMFLLARPVLARLAVIGGVVLCLADWVLVQDFGFLGGVGTDPNSMVPMAIVFVAGYVAMTKLPIRSVVPISLTSPGPAATTDAAWWSRTRAATARAHHKAATSATYFARALAVVGALSITLVGAVPMAFASLQPNADPIIATAFDGPPQVTDQAAPNFTLTDQFGRSVTFSSLRGKTVAVVGLDDVCTSDCPLVAQQFLSADRILGAAAKNVVMVAINLNPQYVQPVFLRAFDNQEKFSHVANWQYLTGSHSELQAVWSKLAFYSQYVPGGAMILHLDEAYVVSATGRIRLVVNVDPGPATEATRSSLAVTLADAIESVEAQPG